MRISGWLRQRVPPLLNESAFRRYWWGRSLSMLGGQISMLAFPLTAVLVLKTGAVGMALLSAVGAVPSLLFSMHVGSWVDRRGQRRQIMIAADLTRALLLACMPAAWAAGFLTLPVLVALWFCFGICSVFFRVASSTIFVALVPRERYAEANSLLEQSRAAGFLVGPAIGGWLIQIFTAPFALLADALSFVASAISLSLLSPTEPDGTKEVNRNLWDGFRYIRTSPVLRSTFASQLTQSLFRAVFMALYVLYGTRSLDIRPAQWGLILGPSSILALAGSAAASRLIKRIGLGPAAIWGAVLFTWPLLAIPWVSGTHPLVVGVFFMAEGLAGAGSMVSGVTTGVIRASAIPNAVRARVTAAFAIAGAGMTPLGALLAALLAWHWGIHATMWVAVLGMASSVFWLVSPAVRNLVSGAELQVRATS